MWGHDPTMKNDDLEKDSSDTGKNRRELYKVITTKGLRFSAEEKNGSVLVSVSGEEAAVYGLQMHYNVSK